jgi:hypothetical protein
VLWRALLCRTQVLDNRNPLPDNRTQITWIIFLKFKCCDVCFSKTFCLWFAL